MCALLPFLAQVPEWTLSLSIWLSLKWQAQQIWGGGGRIKRLQECKGLQLGVPPAPDLSTSSLAQQEVSTCDTKMPFQQHQCGSSDVCNSCLILETGIYFAKLSSHWASEHSELGMKSKHEVLNSWNWKKKKWFPDSKKKASPGSWMKELIQK